MTGILHFSSVSSVFKSGNVTSSMTPDDSVTLTSTPAFLPEDTHIHVHTILIIIIFCIVCLLLLVAFFYAFCFHLTLQRSPKDGRQNSEFSLDREDATFRRTSSSHSAGNII